MPQDITLYMDAGEFCGWGWDDGKRGHRWIIILHDQIAEFDAWIRARGRWEEDDQIEVEMDDALAIELRLRWYSADDLHDGMGNPIGP